MKIRQRLSVLNRLPRTVLFLLGLATTVLGAVITFRPFSSLSALIVLIALGMILTGVATFASADSGIRLARVRGLGWIAAGVAILAWPDLSTRGLATFVGVALIVEGALDVVAGIRGTKDERFASVVGGAASVVFGVLSLAWPDVTLLVVAVVFGARMVLFGLRLAWAALRNRELGEAPASRGPIRRFGHGVVTVVGLVLAVALALVSSRLNEGEPIIDAFYDAPDDIPADPGVLLRSEVYERDVPDGARAWRILYTSSREDGVPALASALVVVPEGAAEPVPVIAWAHGTTGVDRTCAPTVLSSGIGAGAFYSLETVIERGWALVATDYIGLGTSGPHPYLIGQGQARSVLDAVRAARQLEEANVADDTVVWGHSQGGNAALWTGQLAPSYAPDVELAGVAALAPASDLVGLVDNLGTVTGGSVFASFVMSAYIAAYDDVDIDDYVRPTAQVTFSEMSKRCLAEPSVLVSILSSVVGDMSMFTTGDLATGAFGERLRENIPTGPIPAPLLLAQGQDDGLVVPSVQAAFVESLCAAGQQVDYRTYAGRDHVPLVEPDSPLIDELIDWTERRLASEAPRSTC